MTRDDFLRSAVLAPFAALFGRAKEPQAIEPVTVGYDSATSTSGSETAIYIYVYGLDPQNGRFQQTAGEALVRFNQRRGRLR